MLNQSIVKIVHLPAYACSSDHSHRHWFYWIVSNQWMQVHTLQMNRLSTVVTMHICIWYLTHWEQVRHICFSKLTIIGSDNGLSPDRRQAIIPTNAGILLIGPFRINFSEILIEIHKFSFKKMNLKMPSGKWWPFCLSLNVLMANGQLIMLHGHKQDKIIVIHTNLNSLYAGLFYKVTLIYISISSTLV